ncbi:FUSC family protein [Primorskyibacter flagellatus]|uniref:Fusaric acid resistance protein-like n=1 Tax=Primorskyibacter flagellatus TaxID=1387277 RepID=A0A1W2D3Y9_9RHOB|nr:FUSC family protein [Primorskyibacter flagellatus]SMC91778.1 Fusaric acid resistance protein-like [Primorskyibacter flagellatus]
MYVTPRPDPIEDPLYGIRLGLMGALAYLAIPILNPALPPIIAALPVGLIASQRRAFDPGKAIGGVVAMIVLPWIMTWFVEWLRPMPLVYVAAMWLVYFSGFLLILRSGAQAGMLIVVVAVLMSVMGMHGNATVEFLRDGFVQASLVALVVGPLVYLLLPPRTREKQVDDPKPGGGNTTLGAAIRATVLLGLSFWLYAVMQPSDMMMAVVAAMVLVFPTRNAVFDEARQRVRATFYGGAIAVGVLALFTLSPNLPILLGLIFLSGLWLGQKMLNGTRPSMVYQYAFSVALALIAGALSTQDPVYATFTRIVLTLTGAFTAAFTVALLDAMTGWREEAEPDAQGPTVT